MSSPRPELNRQLLSVIRTAFSEGLNLPDSPVLPTSDPKFGDYQTTVALTMAKPLKRSPVPIAREIIARLDISQICEPAQVAGPGFINLTLKPKYVASQLARMQADSRLGISPAEVPKRVEVDFSSPYIAKEMHVGHLRSTIIGDCLARILEFRGHEVLRINHVGDWGTQFGMLIAFLREACPEALTTAGAVALGDLAVFYRRAKKRFDEDAAFREVARKEVVKLQAGAADSTRAWQLLCEQSRREFQAIYNLLDIRLTERGESFYNPFLPAVITDLSRQGLLVENAGANCVFLEGFTNKEGKPQPLIVQKSDGGYNYETTDLAAVRYRVERDRAQRILYVVDVGQSDHFEQVFQVARRAGWLPLEIEAIHVPFGLVQGEDGKKFKTRSGETVKLKDLLNEAIVRARADLSARLAQQGRQESRDFVDRVATVVGSGAVKYADLSQNRLSNYIFSYDKMLSLQGNTAPYLLYAYARIQGIARKSGVELRELTDGISISLQEEVELILAKHVLRLEEAIVEVEQELLPNRLCQYLFELSQKFNQFYSQCPVLEAPHPLKRSRLVLCDLTARILRLGLSLLGIEVLERM